MAQAKYSEARQVKEIAEELIPKHHHHLIDFSVKVRYLFVDKTIKSGGREQLGKVQKVSGVNAYLESGDEGEPFFVMIICQDLWDVLPPEKRIAAVDHYLCYAWAEAKQQKDEADGASDLETDNPVKLSLNQPVQEFPCIVRRHGFWREDCEELFNAVLKGKSSSDDE